MGQFGGGLSNGVDRRFRRLPSDSVTAILHNNLTSVGRESRKLGLQWMDPYLVKRSWLFAFFWLAHRESPPGCEHDQWTVAKISHGMRLGCALLECLATRRGHKRFGLRYNPAMASISTSASFGRRATCTVDRAGGADVKYLAYTSFMAEKSLMSFRKTVVFTT